MKKIVIIIVLLVLIGIVAWFLLSGEKAISPNGEKEEAETKLSLTEILGEAKGITSFKYDITTTVPGEPVITTKMWRKENKTKIEGTFDGKSMIYLVDVDKQLAHIYFSAENTAMKIDLARAQGIAGESPTEQSESIVTHNPATLGTETLDGKSCLVIEYTTETEKVKMWIWKKYGLPIKTESTTDKGVLVVELKNIEFGNIPDSVFELPAGVQIMEIPSF